MILKILLVIFVLIFLAFLVLLMLAVKRNCTVSELLKTDIERYKKTIDRFKRN